MKYHRYFFRTILIVTIACSMGHPALAVNGQNNQGPHAASKKLAPQVRIPLKLTSFKKMLVRDKSGKIIERYIAVDPVTNTLRGRIERVNHFYISDFHIESIPLKWDRDLGNYRTKLRFYQRFGVNQDIEEYIGSVVVNGRLEADNEYFKLVGFSAEKFNNRNGAPVLAVEVGTPLPQAPKTPLLSKKAQNSKDY